MIAYLFADFRKNETDDEEIVENVQNSEHSV